MICSHVVTNRDGSLFASLVGPYEYVEWVPLDAATRMTKAKAYQYATMSGGVAVEASSAFGHVSNSISSEDMGRTCVASSASHDMCGVTAC